MRRLLTHLERYSLSAQALGGGFFPLFNYCYTVSSFQSDSTQGPQHGTNVIYSHERP